MARKQIALERSRMVNNQEIAIDELVQRKDNPRKGNIEKIKESLRENGQYRPIIVNSRNNEILAGNHTWLAAKQLGWESIAVWFIDVDEEKAKKIVLADNRTSDLAEYDNNLLYTILEDLEGDLKGTGFDIDDMEDIMATLGGVIETPYEEFTGDFAETMEETAERYAHRENVMQENEEKRQRVKEVVVIIAEENFDDFVQDIFELKSRWQLGTTSDIIIKAIKDAVQK